MFKTTATFCEVEVAVGCWVLSLSTNYQDLSAIVSSAAPKKVCLSRHTSKTQGIGVGEAVSNLGEAGRNPVHQLQGGSNPG
jgi:hypothetical protein